MRTMIFSLGALVLLTASLAADDGLPPKTLAAIKRATVFVEVEADGRSVSGSGFVVKVEGTSALVVTNHHVVEPTIIAQARTDPNVIPAARPRTVIRPRGPGMTPFPHVPRQPVTPGLRIEIAPRVILRTLKNANVTVVFDSGTKDERSAKAELLALDPEFDLAVMRVKDVKDLPQPINTEKAAELTETMSVYTFGFPFGKVLSTGKKRPAITVGKAAISSLREDDDGELAVVQIDGSLNPGNSGGPIVNSQGELVGVAVATIRNSNGIGLAIPSGPLKNMFAGRIGAIHLAKKPKAEQRTLVVEVGVIDPLDKIAAVVLHYIGMSRVKSAADKEIESLDSVPGSEIAKLTLEKQLAFGEIALASAENEKEFLVQAVYTTTAGKTDKTRIFRQPFQTAAATAAVPGANPAPGGGGLAGPVENVTGKESRIYGGAFDPVFKDPAPEAGLLVGFEFGLGQFTNFDVIKAVRPIYRVGKVAAAVKADGTGKDEGTGKEGPVKEDTGKEVLGRQYGSKLDNVVTVKAEEGYAVAGMTIRAGLLVDGLSLTFMRVTDGKLDPTDSYESDWTGSRMPFAAISVTGNGRPVVGIVGKANDTDCTGLGLLFDRSSSIDKDSRGTNPSRPGIAGGQAESPTQRFVDKSNAEFRELAPEKGLLIGFEIGFGPVLGTEKMKAVRPIFRNGEEEVPGNQLGADLNRVIVVKAKEGYAVGGMATKGSGGDVHTLSLTFLRVGKGKLDPQDSYQSDWIGNDARLIERVVKPDGTPVIGIAGKLFRSDCLRFDLVFEKAGGAASPVSEKPKVLSNAPFREVAPEKGLLIGFEIGFGPILGTEQMKAVRPIFRNGDEEVLGNQLGWDLNRVIVVKAKAGYAVGGMLITYNSGDVHTLSLTFLRVDNGKLDPKDSYQSDLIGNKSAMLKRVVKADGTPVIGIAGTLFQSDCLNFDLVFEKTTSVTSSSPDQGPSPAKPDGGAKQKNSPKVPGKASRDAGTGGATKILGGGISPEFKDQSPEDGLLIGFEVGLGTFGNHDVVKAIRPIYRTGKKGEVVGEQHGTNLDKVVTVKAKEGYAVGGMTIRAGLLVDGLSLTFIRITDGKLDPADSYESDWIGDRRGGSETVLKGDGAPVVGIVGKANDKDCVGLGLVFDKK